MTTLDDILSQPVVARLGWTLIHFVWQGLLIGLLVAGGLAVLRGRSANAKYLACCCGLLLMVAVPVATTVWLLPAENSDSGVVPLASTDDAGAAVTAVPTETPDTSEPESDQRDGRVAEADTSPLNRNTAPQTNAAG